MSLFNRGYDDVDKIAEKEAERRNGDRVFRFWMPTGTTTRIVFLDDVPPIYEEHQLQINGDWKNWFTCLKQFGKPCPHCEASSYAYTAGAYTIIDGTEWKDKQGNVHKNEKKLFVAKIDTLKKLKQISAKRGGLRGCVFEVSRTGDKSPGTGDMFDFEKKLTEEELVAMFGKKDPKGAQGYNYDEILAPKDAEETKSNMNNEAKSNYEEEENVNF